MAIVVLLIGILMGGAVIGQTVNTESGVAA